MSCASDVQFQYSFDLFKLAKQTLLSWEAGNKTLKLGSLTFVHKELLIALTEGKVDAFL